MASSIKPTDLRFHYDAKLHSLETLISSVFPFSALTADNKSLFKDADDACYVIVTEATVFHPQGGGQPSDVGRMQNSTGILFDVISVRMDAENDGQVLHCGRFIPSTSTESSPAASPGFQTGETVTQTIDSEKRILYSRLHTAGHVLGSAVRHLLENEIPGFDELKASHFPDSASCSFQGVIDGKWKNPIQLRVNEYIKKAMPVEIDWWTADDFKENGLERLIPPGSKAPPSGKWRVVKIVGAEVYPCGGTHVDTTDLCGETTVTKIKRSSGTSRVSYKV